MIHRTVSGSSERWIGVCQRCPENFRIRKIPKIPNEPENFGSEVRSAFVRIQSICSLRTLQIIESRKKLLLVRVFSIAGHLRGTRATLMKDENFEQNLFCNVNKEIMFSCRKRKFIEISK